MNSTSTPACHTQKAVSSLRAQASQPGWSVALPRHALLHLPSVPVWVHNRLQKQADADLDGCSDHNNADIVKAANNQMQALACRWVPGQSHEGCTQAVCISTGCERMPGRRRDRCEDRDPAHGPWTNQGQNCWQPLPRVMPSPAWATREATRRKAGRQAEQLGHD